MRIPNSEILKDDIQFKQMFDFNLKYLLKYMARCRHYLTLEWNFSGSTLYTNLSKIIGKFCFVLFCFVIRRQGDFFIIGGLMADDKIPKESFTLTPTPAGILSKISTRPA